MEMIVSLSHEIRVEKQDNVDARKTELAPTDAQERALEAVEQQRIIAEYGIDATPEEIQQKEEARLKKEEEGREDKKVIRPANLGRRVYDDNDENIPAAKDIQNEHDNLIDL